MRIVAPALATLIALIVFVGAVGAALIYSGSYYVGADKPHWPFTAWLLSEARERSIRAHAAEMTEPAELDDPPKIVAGASHYSEHCAVCHGAPGVPKGDIARGLYPAPPDLAVTAKSYSDGELFWIVKHGIKMSGMPAWSDHSDDELWATVAFVRKLPEMTADEYARLLVANMAQGGRHHQAGDTAPPQNHDVHRH